MSIHSSGVETGDRWTYTIVIASPSVVIRDLGVDFILCNALRGGGRWFSGKNNGQEVFIR